VIRSIRDKQWKRREPIQNLLTRFRSSETLKQFLEDQAARENKFAALERPVQRDYVGLIGRCIPSQRQ